MPTKCMTCWPSIDTGSLLGLRDRALIALMGYTFARVSAATGMKVEDFYVQNRRGVYGCMRRAARLQSCPVITTWISTSKNGSRLPD